MKSSSFKLKTALPLKDSLREYDPIASYMSYDWVIYRATLCALTDVDQQNRVMPSAAQAFYWRGDELVFEFDPRFRTIDGLRITAEDAAASLKRTMILRSNYRGYLDGLLDLTRLHALSDDIPQIRTEGDRLVLRPMTRSSCILDILASLDFAIFPRSAIDPETLAIRDLRNTTGPYYVESFGETMILRVNKSHRQYTCDMPQEVEILRDVRDEDGTPQSQAVFKAGQIDFIPHFGHLSAQQVESLAALPNVTPYRVRSLALMLGKYTPKGRLRPAAERRYIARRLQVSVARRLNNSILTPTMQIFPEGGYGALDPARLKVLVDRFDDQWSEPCRHVVLSLPKYCYKVYEENFRDAPFHVRLVEQTEAHLDFASYHGGDDEPDIVLVGLDLSHETAISFLAFALNTGVFGLTRTAAEKWLIDYACEPDEDKRREMARALHFRALYTDPSAIPLFCASLVAVAQGGWTLDQDSTHSLAAFWKLRKDVSH